MKSISLDFLRDETRNGFFIPTAVKQAWAAQLEVLKVIDEICEKHHITYFADWGTLLGTVRHGGYIPWDDDLDICMKRADYIRFKEVAATELPSNFCIHDFAHQKDHWLFLSRVVNHKHICFEPEHLENYYNFPYLASVDIFVLDYLYDDPEKENARCQEIKRILSIADGIVDGIITGTTKENLLMELEQTYSFSIDKALDNTHLGILLYEFAELQMGRVPEKESHSLGQIFPWILKGGKGFEKKYYEQTLRLPFEHTTMPVPAGYHTLLSQKYHDYFRLIKGSGGHDYPFFEGQKANLLAVADFDFPEFCFTRNMIRSADKKSALNQTIKELLTEAITEIKQLHAEFSPSFNLDLLAQCQGIAIEIGNSIETVYGEYSNVAKKIIPAIEVYCEKVFQLYTFLEQTSNQTEREPHFSLLKELETAYKDFLQHLDNALFNKKIIAFLPEHHSRWHELDSLFQYYERQEDAEVFVIPLPLFRKNPYGEIVTSEDDLSVEKLWEFYPNNLNLLPWDNANMELIYFDEIIIQNSYDDENPYLTVPPNYYAKKLQNSTDSLVYLLPQGISDFTLSSHPDCYGLKSYLTTPGTMYADKILYGSSQMREVYLSTLQAFAREDTLSLWENKLTLLSDYIGANSMDTKAASVSKQKTILYCIGINDFVTNEAATLEKVKERLGIFQNASNELQVALYPYPNEESSWEICSRETRDTLHKLLSDTLSQEQFILWDREKLPIADLTAYYGSPSPLILEFMDNKKPVMISEDIV